jgi:hypothetical protein
MSPSNNAVVQRTWGLRELEARKSSTSPGGASSERSQFLSYGPEFKYDEFLITSNSLLAFLLGFATSIVMFCLGAPPVSPRTGHRDHFAHAPSYSKDTMADKKARFKVW